MNMQTAQAKSANGLSPMQVFGNFDHAMAYGVDESIIINAFVYWLRFNKKHSRNQKKGHTWTYNTVKALSELFPYWSEKQIRRILTSLVIQGVLIRDHLSKHWSDRTTWYAFADEEEFLKPAPVERTKVRGRWVEGSADNPEDEMIPSPDAGTGADAGECVDDSSLVSVSTCPEPVADLPANLDPELVADAYDKVFKPHNLKVKRADPHFYAYLQLLCKERTLGLPDFVKVFQQAKIEFLPVPTKKGYCKWDLLFKRQFFFSLLDNASIVSAPRPQAAIPHSGGGLTKLSPEQAKANLKMLQEIQQRSQGAGKPQPASPQAKQNEVPHEC